jgi:hypothetical protein
MTLSLHLHNAIMACNILQRPTERMNAYFRSRPEIYKAALIANHIFRAAAMSALMLLLPMSVPASACLCLAGSLFYRLSVENHCAYKFALPAFAGSLAFLIGKTALVNVASGAAFASLGTLSAAVIPLLPLTAYLAYIVLTVDYDVDH